MPLGALEHYNPGLNLQESALLGCVPTSLPPRPGAAVAGHVIPLLI